MRSLVGNVRRTPPSGAQLKASVLWRGGCDESEAAGEVASCRVNQHGQLCFGHLALVVPSAVLDERTLTFLARGQGVREGALGRRNCWV
jgi:hypothetical protein